MSVPEGVSLIGVAEPLVLSVDAGGTTTSITRGEEIIEKWEEAPTPKDLDRALGTIAAFSEQILGGKKPDAVGFGIAGEISEDGSTITRGGPLQKYGWVGQPIRNKVADALGIEPGQVHLINDAAAAGYAERKADERTGQLTEYFTGLIQTISSGNGGALYDKRGSRNIEPGHKDANESSGTQCGCGAGDRCIETHIAGNPVGERWGVSLKDASRADPRWEAYRNTLSEKERVLLDRLAEEGIYPDKLAYFGSVILKGPKVFEQLAADLSQSHPHIQVRRATYEDRSGLQGAAFEARDQALAA